MAYETLLLEISDHVGVVTLNRPEARNALNNQLMDELASAIDTLEADDAIRCIVITGSSKAFAAGADIKEMQSFDFMSAYRTQLITRNWERVASCRKPVIAAVAGYALGGGCELAMMCDFIIAADNAKFGQPEINLGVLPGAGGTQRLTRFIGKSKAMDMCLTGRMMSAKEAERVGLVSRIFEPDALMDEVLTIAKAVAAKSAPIAMMTKQSVNTAYETTLSQGIQFERHVFHSVFASSDQSEGMEAFVEKRDPHFRDK